MARGGSCKITRSPAAAGETPAKMSKEPSGGNGANYEQDARYRGDGDEASFRERDKQLIAFLSALPAVFSDSNSWFKAIAPLLISRVSGAFGLDSGGCHGFLLFGERCVLCGVARKKNKASRCCEALLCQSLYLSPCWLVVSRSAGSLVVGAARAIGDSKGNRAAASALRDNISLCYR